MFAIRLAGPPNLMDNDQERPASYVLDAVLNGHWACQVDWMGDVTSKPPLYTWLAGLATLPFDRISLFSLYLPAALSVAGMACLILFAGRKYFGPTGGPARRAGVPALADDVAPDRAGADGRVVRVHDFVGRSRGVPRVDARPGLDAVLVPRRARDARKRPAGRPARGGRSHGVRMGKETSPGLSPVRAWRSSA